MDAYEKAKLRYKIDEDGNMLRSIAFHRIKKIKPERYYKFLTQVIRLRSEDKKKEFIVFQTQEGAFDGGDREHNDSIRYGVEELIHTIPNYNTATGKLINRTIDVHKNVFTIPYSKKAMEEIFDSQIPKRFKIYDTNEIHEEEIPNPKMMVGILSENYPALWQPDQIYAIKNREIFISATFDELLLVGFTGENNIREAMNKARKMIADSDSMNEKLASQIKEQISSMSQKEGKESKEKEK